MQNIKFIFVNFSEKVRKNIFKSYETHTGARLNINQVNGFTEGCMFSLGM